MNILSNPSGHQSAVDLNTYRYQRILAKDASCNGSFLTGVLTTGIYCLPSCPARKPKLENVRFFEEEAAAIAAGLRACKRCQPDLFYRGTDWDAQLYQSLLGQLRANIGQIKSVSALAERCGVSLSKINELVRSHAHLRPAALLRREQIRLARQLLLAGSGTVIDAGLAAGFDSAATFHRQFLASTGMTPAAYRLLAQSDRFAIALPPQYRQHEVLAYFARDTARLAEQVHGQTINKAFMAEGGPAILSIHLPINGGPVSCQLSSTYTLSPQDKAQAHQIALRMLGLDTDAQAFEQRAASDGQIFKLLGARQGLRMPVTANVFEGLLWAIVGQQVNIPFATRLRGVVIELAGKKVAGSDLRLHPSAGEVAELEIHDLCRMKFSRSKADYLLSAARAVADGALPLEDVQDRSALLIERSLLAQRGIGPWSAAYIMLRGMGLADCTPVGDSGLTEGLKRFYALPERPDQAHTRALMADFAPHRSLATCHLWASLKDSSHA